MDLGDPLGGMEGGETVFGIYYMREEIYFQLKNEKNEVQEN